jgi:hypothetical protein
MQTPKKIEASAVNRKVNGRGKKFSIPSVVVP